MWGLPRLFPIRKAEMVTSSDFLFGKYEASMTSEKRLFCVYCVSYWYNECILSVWHG